MNYNLRSNLRAILLMIFVLFINVLASIYILQHQTISSIRMISEDIERDLVVSNIASAERRIEILKLIGQPGLYLEIHGFTNPNKIEKTCLSKYTLPVLVDGVELANITNCLALDNILLTVIHSPSVISLHFATFLLILLFWIIRLRFQQVSIEIKKNQAVADISRQVAHDIRSPLSALMMLTNSFDSVPEEKRLIIRGSIQRINDIANDLLIKSKNINSEFQVDSDFTKKIKLINDSSRNSLLNIQPELIPSIVDLILSEKRIQFRDKISIEIISNFNQCYADFALVDAMEIKRVISNLINNSVEAFNYKNGKILVSITSDTNIIKIIINDNGKGMPENILKKLGEKGISYGKIGSYSGSGLGIYHAKKCIENLRGQFEISSVVGIGTTISISLPKTKAPEWFVEKIIFKPNTQIISVDDDLSIHQIWKERLKSINSIKYFITLLCFTSAEEFLNYMKSKKDDISLNTIFFVDYELLNQNVTGLDLIENLNLGHKAILVTSHYEEFAIRNRCANAGVKIIPKGMAGFVPLSIEKTKNHFHAILIDDDELIHLTWKMVALEKNKSIQLFKTKEEFLAMADEIDFKTPIYIDVHLGNNVNGIEVAKDIYKFGFLKIFLATGYSSLEKPSFIEAIVGKEPQI